jgi:hypothetical protein
MVIAQFCLGDNDFGGRFGVGTNHHSTGSCIALGASSRRVRIQVDPCFIRFVARINDSSRTKVEKGRSWIQTWGRGGPAAAAARIHGRCHWKTPFLFLESKVSLFKLYQGQSEFKQAV